MLAAAVGAILVNLAEGRLSDVFVEGWHLLLGVLFLMVVMFMPRGIYGVIVDAGRAMRRKPVSKKEAQPFETSLNPKRES